MGVLRDGYCAERGRAAVQVGIVVVGRNVWQEVQRLQLRMYPLRRLVLGQVTGTYCDGVMEWELC